MTETTADDVQPQSTTKGGHPKGLMVLFSAEMWERFCYYTMRGLLTLYLTKALMMGDQRAFAIYGAYTALVYAAPVIGGRVADKILGYRRAVILGGVMMMIGEFVICLGTEDAMYLGMGIIIVGNGYFKANISSIVGKLYKDGDPRRDSGFTIFYMGINVGAVGATLIGAPVGEGLAGTQLGHAGYLVGFALAGVGMIFGLLIFMRGKGRLEGHGEPPNLDKLKAPYMLGLSLQTVTIIASFAAVPALYFLIQYKTIVDVLLLVALGAVVIQLMQAAFRDGDKVQRDRIFVLMILMFFNVVFWACFEQAGSSLTLFADRNVDRSVFGLFEMPASQTQFFNPAFIILFGSVFSVLWVKLDQRNINPNIPMKFGLGIIQLGLGYLVIYVGATMAGADARVPLAILMFMYLLHTTGELFLSPIGLSMVTKLAPKDLTGSVMGAWFLSFAFSNSLAATIAQQTGVEGEVGLGTLIEGGEQALRPTGAIHQMIYVGQERLKSGYLDEVAAAAKTSLASYVDIYTTMGLITIGIGVLLVLGSGWLNKMMHGVK